MSDEVDVRKTLKDLNEKLDLIIRRLDHIEQTVAKYPEGAGVSDVVYWLKTGVRLYDEPLKVLNRLLSLSKVVERPGVQMDELSRLIAQSLALRGPMNISKLTREIRTKRGKASRKTVRARLETLLSKGIIRRSKTAQYCYELASQE
ncbi:MAG: hypothetical protein QW587_04315 [Candidatus Bathyarchaeia archaeon]